LTSLQGLCLPCSTQEAKLSQHINESVFALVSQVVFITALCTKRSQFSMVAIGIQYIMSEFLH